MRKGELIPRGILLATALAGVALVGCQRQPEATPLPQQTPIAASGEPRPPDIEAEIQKRVQATVTAQKIPELELSEASGFEFKYPKGWIKDYVQGVTSFIDPQSPKDYPTRLGVSAWGRTTASIKDYMKEKENQKHEWLKGFNYKGPPPKIKQLPDIDGKPAFIISVERHPNTRGPEYDLQEVHILAESGTIQFTLATDPSVTDKAKPLFEAVVQSFKERGVQKPAQQAARPAAAPATPRAEAPRQTQPKAEQERPKTLLEQAIEKSIETWINLIPSFHDIGNGGLLGIRLSPNSTPLEKLLNPNIPPDQKLIKVKWISLPWGFGTNKIVGEAEIKNIKSITTPMGLSEADRANGILFSGAGSLTYIIRYRATEYTFRYTFGPHKNEAWSTSHKDRLKFANTTDAPWSLWQEAGKILQVRLVNGNWTMTFSPGLPIDIIDQTKGGLPTAPSYVKSDIPLPDAIAQKIKVESDLVKNFDIP